MTKIDTENTIKLPDVVDTSKFIIPRGAELLMLYAKNKKDVKKTYKQLKATHFPEFVPQKNPPKNLQEEIKQKTVKPFEFKKVDRPK